MTKTKKRNDIKALLELDMLVNTNGDPNRIQELRDQLGIVLQEEDLYPKEPKPKNQKAIEKFNPELYIQMKTDGYKDYQIADHMGISKSTLYLAKRVLGMNIKNKEITNDEAYNHRKKAILAKLGNQKVINTSIVIGIVNALEDENQTLRNRIKELERSSQ